MITTQMIRIPSRAHSFFQKNCHNASQQTSSDPIGLAIGIYIFDLFRGIGHQHMHQCAESHRTEHHPCNLQCCLQVLPVCQRKQYHQKHQYRQQIGKQSKQSK